MKTTMEEPAPYMRGWRGYFGFCETPEVLIGQNSPGPVGGSGQPCGGSGKHSAAAGPLCWNWGCESGWPTIRPAAGSAPGTSQRPKPFLSGFPMPISNRSVFLRYSRIVSVTSRTAVYGPVRTVVWQGSAGDRRPYADQRLLRIGGNSTSTRLLHGTETKIFDPRDGSIGSGGPSSSTRAFRTAASSGGYLAGQAQGSGATDLYSASLPSRSLRIGSQ